jgi:molecular chaperone GrpE
MSEETKQPAGEETQAEQETPETQAGQEPAQAAEPEQAETAQPEKKAKKKKEKEKTYTLTREQMEAAELAAKQLEAVKDQFTRLTAEYDNYRKRTTKEKENIYQDAKADTVKAFLAVYDNLERAVSAEGGEDSPHKKGLEMIFHQYREILTKLSVTEIACKGQPFDPEKMEAVMHIEDESLGENEVAQVFQAGFEMNGKVIRHAIVQVAN